MENVGKDKKKIMLMTEWESSELSVVVVKGSDETGESRRDRRKIRRFCEGETSRAVEVNSRESDTKRKKNKKNKLNLQRLSLPLIVQ